MRAFLLLALLRPLLSWNYTMYPMCSQVMYLNDDVNPDIYSTVYNCMSNITDALDPPR